MAKKNKSYWQNRQEQWLTTQDEEDARVVKKLEQEYQRTAKELEKDIATYFNQYGQDNVIEFRTMLQGLSDADRKLLFQDMDRFAEKYPQYADLMPVRESIYQLNRLEGLHYSTQMKLLELGAIEQEELLKHLEKTYGKHYQNMLKELGIGNQFLAIDNVTMRNTLFTGWVNGENFSDRIWANKEKMLEHMQTVYRDGLARGDNYAKLTKAIRERFDVGASDAKRLVWTESTFVLNQAHTQAYRNAGVEEYEISAIRDNKTSPICRDMDGQVFRFDEMEVGLNFPPFHPYCRTTFIGLIDGLLNVESESDVVSNADIKLNDTITSKLSNEEIEEIKRLVGDAPQEIQEMWNKHIGEVNWSVTTQGNYYHPATRQVNMKISSLKTGDREDYSVLFHEFAHNIDALAGEKEFGDQFKFMSGHYSDNFTKLLKKDADDYIKLQQKRLKDAVKEQWIDGEFSQKILLDGNEVIIFDKKVSKSTAKSIVAQQLSEKDFKSIGSTADIFEGSASIFSQGGHGKNYWKNKDNLSREAFAHMTEATITNKESLNEIKKHFPNAYDEYFNIVKKINGS